MKSRYEALQAEWLIVISNRSRAIRKNEMVEPQVKTRENFSTKMIVVCALPGLAGRFIWSSSSGTILALIGQL